MQIVYYNPSFDTFDRKAAYVAVRCSTPSFRSMLLLQSTGPTPTRSIEFDLARTDMAHGLPFRKEDPACYTDD